MKPILFLMNSPRRVAYNLGKSTGSNMTRCKPIPFAFAAACNARDLERVAASFAPDLRHFDRRGLMRLESDRDEHLAWARMVFERAAKGGLHVRLDLPAGGAREAA